MKYPIKITKIEESHIEIEAGSLEEALQLADYRYNTLGLELPDMDGGTALTFELDNEQAVKMPLFEESPKYYVCTTNPMGSTWYLDDKNADDCTLWSGAPEAMRAAYDTIVAAEEKVKELETRHPSSHANYHVEKSGTEPAKTIPNITRKGR